MQKFYYHVLGGEHQKFLFIFFCKFNNSPPHPTFHMSLAGPFPSGRIHYQALVTLLCGFRQKQVMPFDAFVTHFFSNPRPLKRVGQDDRRPLISTRIRLFDRKCDGNPQETRVDPLPAALRPSFITPTLFIISPAI